MGEMKKKWVFMSNKQFVVMLNKTEEKSLKKLVQQWHLFRFDKVNKLLNSKRSQRILDISIANQHVLLNVIRAWGQIEENPVISFDDSLNLLKYSQKMKQ